MTEQPRVNVFQSEYDGRWCVQIDTDPNIDGEPELLVFLNDATLYDETALTTIHTPPKYGPA